MIDTSTILSTMLSTIIDMIKPIWFLLPILAVLLFLKTSKGKGKFGEFIVNSKVKSSLDEDYYLLKDVTLPSRDGTTQIDHIIVSKFGIFVIETKNMSGWIFGDAKQRYWTQVIFKEKNRFQNPLHQNYKHIKTLQEILGVDEDKIHSVIVFIGDCEFKTPMPPNVLKGGYIDYIKSFKKVVFSKTYMQKLIEKIEKSRLTKGIKTYIKHIKNVKRVIANKA